MGLLSCQKEPSMLRVSDTGQVLPGSADPTAKTNTFKGPEVRLGNGMVRSFFVLNHAGEPQELGLEMTSDAFYGLPEDPEAHPSYVIPLHPKTRNLTPFDHIWVNWNVEGHEPLFLFGVPHFDFHFYAISVAEREAIGPVQWEQIPASGYMPASYVPTDGGVPQMGKHWIDTQHPVIPGNFTQTMIYGSSSYKWTFVEPMITRAYLLSGANFSIPFDQPAMVSRTGVYYPTVYNIYMDQSSHKHYVTLSGFVKR